MRPVSILGRSRSSRRSNCSLLLALAVAVFAAPLACAKAATDTVRFVLPRLSPDGRLVAFDFTYGEPDGTHRGLGANPHGVGLYEWQTGRLIRILNPEGKQIGEPSFSDDGKKLAVAIGRRSAPTYTGVAVVDLATMAVKQITPDDTHALPKNTPVFQPGADNILYSEKAVGTPGELKLVNIQSGDERIVGGGKGQDFFIVLTPYFVGHDEIYFRGVGPKNDSLKRELQNIGVPMTSAVAYRLRLGDLPEILLPALERSRKKGGEDPILGLAASRNGEVLVGNSRNLTQPTINGSPSYELFRIEGEGRLIQLTDIKTRMAWPTISYDGSTTAFAADPKRTGRFDLYVLNMRDGKLAMTGLLDKLNSNPSFVSP